MAFTKIVGAGIATDTDVQVDDILAGIVTATRFDGDGSQLSGLPGGLGTALSSDSTSALSAIYTNDRILSIGATITIDVPDSSAGAYTQYTDIVVDADADLIIADGDDFIPDILGLSTSGPAEPLAGGGGRIRADNITNKAGTGAVNFPSGVNASGITTVAELHVGVDTGFFTEDLVVNGSARITGIFTVGRDTLIFDGAKNSITVGSGVTIDGSSGIITATRFDGDGSNLSGIDATSLKDADGNVVAQANASGLMLTGIATVTSGKLMVGTAYVSSGAVGLGSTTTAGRDAGIGTMTGSMIYNVTNNKIESFGPQGWKVIANMVETGMNASGGVINDYELGGKYYRSHTFTSSGTFTVTEISETQPNNIEYMVVAGGGGGGGMGPGAYYYSAGGGGGAGGFRTNLTGHPLTTGAPFPVSGPASYTVTVGGGANGGYGTNGLIGSNSAFDSITANGGGGGASGNTNGAGAADNGGSGGGGSRERTTAGSGNTPPTSPPQGNPGSNGSGRTTGGGGGGATSAGGSSGTQEDGGSGAPIVLQSSTAQLYAGGGSGGAGGPSYSPVPGGPGGGGAGGALESTGGHGTEATGGGGGGGGASNIGPKTTLGGNGGSGIVVVRYEIAQGDLAVAKATGGSISVYNGKVLHVFNSSGTFTTESNWTSSSVEYVMIGGGGAGGDRTWRGGGGGAGAYYTGTFTIGSHPVATTITIGGGGNSVGAAAFPSSNGNGSNSVITNPGTTITAAGGGQGGTYPDQPAIAGGSGGGAGGGPSAPGSNGGAGSGDPFPGSIGATPPNGWGHDGGATILDDEQGAGGGGAGAAGTPNSTSLPTRGFGGSGVLIPTTFRNPKTIIGDSRGNWYLGGGGNGGGYPNGQNPLVKTTVPLGGGGFGGISGPPLEGGYPAEVNTGSGGGGASGTPDGKRGGSGGSGIVIISYPV